MPVPQTTIPRLSMQGEGGYETSISCCESDRGTHGRGTPPPIDPGQPHLDDLFRQLHVSISRNTVDREILVVKILIFVNGLKYKNLTCKIILQPITVTKKLLWS